MDIFTRLAWVGTLVFLLVSFGKDKAKTKDSLKAAVIMGRGMVLSILTIIFALGLLLTILPPAKIAQFVGAQSPLLATILAGLFGTITLVPAFIAFPLVGTLIEAGISVVPAVAFLTTLTMVGLVTFPLEKKEFGLKFTMARNVFSFVFAIIIALLMGVIM